MDACWSKIKRKGCREVAGLHDFTTLSTLPLTSIRPGIFSFYKFDRPCFFLFLIFLVSIFGMDIQKMQVGKLLIQAIVYGEYEFAQRLIRENDIDPNAPLDHGHTR